MSKRIFEVGFKLDGAVIDDHSSLKPNTIIQLNPIGPMISLSGTREKIKENIIIEIDKILDGVEELYENGDAEITKSELRVRNLNDGKTI